MEVPGIRSCQKGGTYLRCKPKGRHVSALNGPGRQKERDVPVMEPKGRHVAEMPLRATTKGGTCLRCEPKGRHVAEVIKRLLPFLSLIVARCSLVFSWCRPDHLSDVPHFWVRDGPRPCSPFYPCLLLAARWCFVGAGPIISATCRPLTDHAEKGRHVPVMAIPWRQRAARRADGKTMPRKGGTYL